MLVTVLAEQRREYILGRLRDTGAVRVSELVRHLGVSDMTVRRDLNDLAARGLAHKVHGGATSTARSTDEPGFTAKSARELAEKRAIAAAAAALVSPGSAIGISAGTTTWMFARELLHVPGLTVVTNSVQVAELLHAAGGAERTVVLTGGVRTPSDALVGPVAVCALRSLNLDVVFMGVHGMDERGGFTTPNLLEADTDRALVAAGRRLVVLADHTKWGVVGISTFARLDEADVLVTDEGIDPVARQLLQESVGELLVAPPVAVAG